MSKGLRESQEERVLHSIFIVTIEDLRWLNRVQRDLPELLIGPTGVVREVLKDFLVLINEGSPMPPESRSTLTRWMEIDKHWLTLFRENITGRGYPLARQIQKRVSNRYFGGELYLMWEPDELLDKAEKLGPFDWKIAPEYTIPYDHELHERPTVGAYPVEVPWCEWKTEEREVLYFFGTSDMETFIRTQEIPNISIKYPEKFWDIKEDLKKMADEPSSKYGLSFMHNLDKTKLLESCLRNDYIWWQILERELERVFLFTVSLRVFGRRIYNFNDLRKVVDKLYNCEVAPREKIEEMQMRAKTIADQLFYPFEKAEAEEHGFSDVKAYEKWKEDKMRRDNDFLGIFVGPGDQELITDWVENYYHELELHPEERPDIDAVDTALVNYGYDFSNKQHHRGYRLMANGKWVYTSNMIYNKEDVFKEPYEERSFPTNNYELDREVVMEVLKRKGFVFTPKGWKLPLELHIKRLLDDRVEEIFGSNASSYRMKWIADGYVNVNAATDKPPKFEPEEREIEVELRVWEPARAEAKLREIEEKEPELLTLDGYELHFLIRAKDEP